jgi:hypothetical protein
MAIDCFIKCVSICLFFSIVIVIFFHLENADISLNRGAFGFDSDLPCLCSPGICSYVLSYIHYFIIFFYDSKFLGDFRLTINIILFPQIFLIQKCVDDWRIAMTWKRIIIQITLELLVCVAN